MTDDNRTDDYFTDNHNPKNQSAGEGGTRPVHRPGRQLAEAVLRETDHDKILKLAQELCDAVDEQVLGYRRKTCEEQPLSNRSEGPD